MGILDDAIREHLDLKRRQGAADSEIQRLEDEAFGPPTRPGEPDFPEPQQTSEHGTQVAEAAPGTSDEAEPPLFDHGTDEGTESVAPPVSEGPPPAEAPPVAAEPPSEFALELDDPASHLASLAEPAAPPPPSEPPIESLDTVEHHFEGAIEDTGEEPPVAPEGEAPAVAPEPGEQPLDTAEEEAVSGEVEEEDVLEETPEFLREQPEDDELWFEQGEPKDFDF